MHVMHPRMPASVPWALVMKAEPVASILKVKAPTVSKIHTACQWAVTRFSSLVPFDTNEWDQPLINNIHEVVPHYWDKVEYKAKPSSLEPLPHQISMTDEWQSKLDDIVVERDQTCRYFLISCAM